jgi:ligand-binding sensor domain-containing protein/tRNA A-37 threonylcarbamoyl transferase component Bud32
VKFKKYFCCGCLFYFSTIFCLWGLHPQKYLSQYVLSVWKIERGLPSNSIMSIVQDRSGYLWLGTFNGLVRFDGVNFKSFTRENTPAVSDDLVSCLYEDRKGILWIGYYSGDLVSLHKGIFQRHTFQKKGKSYPIYCLKEDQKGNLWIGTAGGLFCRQAGQSEKFAMVADFSGHMVYCLLEDVSGRLWLGAGNYGLFKYENEHWQPVKLSKYGCKGDVISLCQAGNGEMWIGTDQGIYRYSNESPLRYSLNFGITNTVTCLLEDRDGNLWAGSEGGVYRIQNGRHQFLNSTHGLGNNLVHSLCEDKDGSLWVGTLDGGMTQLRDETIVTISEQEGMSGTMVRSLHGDNSGALLIGGQGGYLNRLLAGRFSNYILPKRIFGGCIWSLEVDTDGSFWLGGDRGLYRWQNSHFQAVSLPENLKNSEIRCVYKDRSGRLWAASWGQGVVCRQTDGTFKRCTIANGLPDSRVACIFEDRQGDIWIGSEGGAGIVGLGEDGVFTYKTVLSDCQVVSFYQDMQGVFWIGTRNQGLKVLHAGRLGTITTDQGLFDNRIYAIVEDSRAYLWLSSERGIFRARKSELERAAFDPKQKVCGQLFDENDGMKSRICNNGNPAAWKDDSGRLWFANLAGVVSVDPARLGKNDRVPPVRLEEVLVDHNNWFTHDLDRPQEVKLPAGSQRFEFRYTALSFIRSDKIVFKYKLEGYDRDWTSAGNRRDAFYNNLSPGRYCFRVMAANADGVWNMIGASFYFYLRPFVYQTWWFMVLAAMAFAMLSVISWQLLKKYLRAVSFWKKKTQIGHFKILETIGTGGMATVYKAQDMLDKKRIVALKVLKEENFHDELQKKRFKHESLITEQLDHPHIVHIIERGEMDDCWYIAMELLRGESLALLIKRGGRLPVGEALDIMLQITDALQAIHAQNIVHRDLKPENIMVSERHGRRHFVKLLDFGLAITPAQSRLTMSGVVMGTIRYLPPERISDGTSSPAGDIYAAGVILYEMLTASKPFWSEATGEVIHRILKTYPLPPREISSEVPQELNALIMAMIDKDPAHRPLLTTIRAELQRLAEKFPPQA